MLADLDPLIVFYILIGLSAALTAEALYLLFYSKKSYHSRVNRRLQVMEAESDRGLVLSELRRERGISTDGGFAMGAKNLNRLIIQSGTTLGVQKLIFIMIGSAIFCGIATFIYRNSVLEAGAATLLGGTLLPYMGLRYLRKKRHRMFGEQFAEAIDIIVRSLRAGHPVPIAISMVAREIADPVGTEFGMVADEVAYGSDLETAMRNMMERVGQEDLPLFVTSVAIQATTGGNLAEILSNLSGVIRGRFKMRRKIKALSAEGKTSAYILTATPFFIFFSLNSATPDFYGDVWTHHATPYVLGGALGWMAIGNMVMMKMINFKF